MAADQRIASSGIELMSRKSFIINADDRILVTGASGFIGLRVIQGLLDRGFRNIACFVRFSSNLAKLEAIVQSHPRPLKLDILKGNLLAPADCDAACKDAVVAFHLAAGTGEKSIPGAFMNSVVTTRNLFEACSRYAHLKRLVLVSSVAVYTNRQKSQYLDESCPVEPHPELRNDAYCFAKVKQEQIVVEYAKKFGIPHVVIRPGTVYGPGKRDIAGRVGIGIFGLFLHLGGSNKIPFTYVENCAEAIVLAGLVKAIEGEAFNIVDDDLPTSRQFLSLYKKRLRPFKSVYVPHIVSYGLCYLWEKYSQWSKGQLPPAFNRGRWYAQWRKTRYSNEKLKTMLDWKPKVSTAEGLRLYFRSCAQGERHV
jgi:nucleoside-diphosphate-sugar epimerase